VGDKNFIRVRADWVRIIEAAVDDTGDDRAWGEALVAALKSALPRSEVVGFLATPTRLELAPSAILVAPGWSAVEETIGTMHRAPLSAFEAFFNPPAPVVTQHEILRASHQTVGSYMRGTGHLARVPDAVGLVTHPTPEWTVALFASHDSEIVLTRHERRLLARVAMHVEAGFRARKMPGAVKATITADGRVITRECDAPSERALALRSADIARARSRASRSDAEATGLWPALVAGRVSLIPRGSSGKRRFDVIENSPSSVGPRALTKGEIDVLDRCIRGGSTKLTAYALGVSPSLVSARLGNAVAKLGLASRVELLRLASVLAAMPVPTLDDVELTRAEREILALLERGLSNHQIATLRSRSTRTVANQVASLLRKTKSTSRRALVVRRA
jgi:DNA-binding CsgD family transcriptional regulator